MPDFLLEIGCEEIPARMIDAASLELRDAAQAPRPRTALACESLTYLDTPRRLAVLAQIFRLSSQSRRWTDRYRSQLRSKMASLPPRTPSLKAGVDISPAERTQLRRAVPVRQSGRGRSAAEILAEALPKELASLYWPKNMYWRKPNERFVRPVRWLVAMLGDEVIPLEFDGVRAGNQSRGHRILADGPVAIPRAGTSYVEALEKARVLSREQREKLIRKALDAATRTIPGARAKTNHCSTQWST
jgi:glycyl-tRNA synthetase beta chain